MADSSTSPDDQTAGIGDRLTRELELWLEFAPEAIGSIGFLIVLWTLTILVSAISWVVGVVGTALWLGGVGVWVVLGRRPRSGTQ